MAVDEQRGPGARFSTADSVAGFLSALAFLGGALALVWYPGRVGTAAILVALVAAALADAQQRLAAWALGVATACWFAGMILAVTLDRPIF